MGALYGRRGALLGARHDLESDRSHEWLTHLGLRSSVDSAEAMQWKLLGLFPVVRAMGSDITRSGIGRVQGESVWLPSVLCSRAVSWSAPDTTHATATLTMLSETTSLALSLRSDGQLERVKFERWGNPDGENFGYADFGGLVEEERTFAGYTIPTRLRLGWYFGHDRFESEGEFFRVTIDDANYR